MINGSVLLALLILGSLMLDVGCHWPSVAGVARFLRMYARACITYSRTYVPVRAQIGNLKDAMAQWKLNDNQSSVVINK